VAEHILVCLSGAPSNEKVIRASARLAEMAGGTFTALFVETPDLQRWSEADRQRLSSNRRLAEELGARITTVYGDEPAIQIAEYAKLSGVTRIVLGKSPANKLFGLKRTPLADRLCELLPEQDIYLISDRPGPARFSRYRQSAVIHLSLRDTLRMFAVLLLGTAVGYLFFSLGISEANIITVYVLGVLITAIVTTGRLYSLMASVLSVLMFNFCFSEPYFSLLSAPDNLPTYLITLTVALLGSYLATSTKRQAAQSATKAYRTEILLETSRKLQKAMDADAIFHVAATQLSKLLERDLVLYPLQEDGSLGEVLTFPFRPENNMAACTASTERAVAEWVFAHNRQAGTSTNAFPGSACLYLAVRGSTQVEAVFGVRIQPNNEPEAFEKTLMVAILDECGLALEKDRVLRLKQKVEEAARQEKLRANLLRAISHDLRTPLTSISGNAGILMENGPVLDETKKQSLYTMIYDDSLWLINLVENLLSITRMENGTMQLNLQPELIEEIFAEALRHLDRRSAGHTITRELEDDLLMAQTDARLIVQVIINLVNNAIKYTPAGSHILLSAHREGDMVKIAVADDGPGIPEGSKERIFDMFYTGGNKRGDSRRGLGLGLALCRSIVTAHGGSIFVEENEPCGARFVFTLPAVDVSSWGTQKE